MEELDQNAVPSALEGKGNARRKPIDRVKIEGAHEARIGFLMIHENGGGVGRSQQHHRLAALRVVNVGLQVNRSLHHRRAQHSAIVDDVAVRAVRPACHLDGSIPRGARGTMESSAELNSTQWSCWPSLPMYSLA